MKAIFSFLFLSSAAFAWAQGTYSVREVSFDGHAIELDLYFETQANKFKTEPFSSDAAIGPIFVDPNTPIPPGRPSGFGIGMELRDIRGSIIYSGSRSDSVDLKPGTYSVRCWSDSAEIENPPDFTFEVKLNRTQNIELVFRSKTLKKEDIDPSLFESQ